MAYYESIRGTNYKKVNELFEQVFNSLVFKCTTNQQFSRNDFVMNRYYPFYYYALFLFKYKQKMAMKYFDYCLQLRPLNTHLHYQYSSYLYNIVQRYDDAWYHLKLSVKRNSTIQQLLNINNKIDNVDQGLRKHFIHYSKRLYLQCGKHPKCGNEKCNRVIVKKTNSHTCSGCKCIMYCSKKCQKVDWKLKHKQKCIVTIVFAQQTLSKQQMTIIKQIETVVQFVDYKTPIN